MEKPTSSAASGGGGRTPSYYRPPYGDGSAAGHQHGYHVTNPVETGQRAHTGISLGPAYSSNAFVAGSATQTQPAASPTPSGAELVKNIIGAADCEDCKKTPALHLAPCGDTICMKHYICIPPSILQNWHSALAVCGRCSKRVANGLPVSQPSHLNESSGSQLTAATSISSGPGCLASGALVRNKPPKNSPPKSVTFDLPGEGICRPIKPTAHEAALEVLHKSLQEYHRSLKIPQLGTSSPAATGGARSRTHSAIPQPFLVQESSPRKLWFSNQGSMSEQMDQRRSSLGSFIPSQTNQAQQQSSLGFPHSKSTPDMTELGTTPSTSIVRGASIWSTHPSGHSVAPRIAPSPIAEAPDEDVFSRPADTMKSHSQGGKTQANEFPSADIMDEINARMPQFSLRHGSLSSGSSLAPSRQNTTPSTTPSKAASRYGSRGNVSPRTVMPFQGEIEQSATPTPLDKGRAEKRRLVDLIKSGALTPDDDHPSQPAGASRQRDQATNAAQYTPTFVDLAYHVTTQESAQFFTYLQNIGGQLSLSDAFTLIPFVEKARMAKPKNWGVTKITNIPYGTTKPEIVAFLGRNARLVQQPQGSPWYAIHIIMERSTAKTMDCFVEFETQKDADHAVDRFKRQCLTHRHPRIGDRHVDMTESSQAALMKELFPRAKCVRWEGQDPHPYETTEPYNSGFKGFTNSEEMVMTVKHAEVPQRSPFSHKCYQRTYESLISILYKFPWWSVENYTLGERDRILYATVSLVKALQSHRFRHNPTNPQQLTPQLHQELVFAALNCPGFSESQKYAVIKTAVNHREEAPGRDTWWGLSQFAPGWVFRTLGRKEGVGEDMLHYFVKLLHDASTSTDFLSLAEHRSTILAVQNGKSSPFGKCQPEYETDPEHTTMAEAAHMEWTTIESHMRRVLPSSRRSSSGSIAGQIAEY